LVVEYAKRYGVSEEKAIEQIKEDLKAVRDDIMIDRHFHTGIFSRRERR